MSLSRVDLYSIVRGIVQVWASSRNEVQTQTQKNYSKTRDQLDYPQFSCEYDRPRVLDSSSRSLSTSRIAEYNSSCKIDWASLISWLRIGY